MHQFLVRLLGLLHGCFALAMLYLLFIKFPQGIIGVGTQILLLSACAWSAWKHPRIAHIFAWLSIAVFVLGAVMFAASAGSFSLEHPFIPTFYIAVIARSAAAASLWFLTRPRHSKLVVVKGSEVRP
jgi:hypothetical protein